MNLSKSKYCSVRQCPKMLWLDTYKPELAEADCAAEARFSVGREVGELAKGLFGDHVDVTTFDGGKPDLSAMLEKTERLVADGAANICEAAFSYNGLYCAVDILHKQGGGYAIYEVKSSTHFKQVYAVDIAYQKYVLQKCGVNVSGTYLVHINTDYVRGETLDVQKLFKIIDVSEQADAELRDIERNLVVAERTLALTDEPNIDINVGCFSPYECAYKKHCSEHLPSPSVFDLYRMPLQRKLDLYRGGKCSFESLYDSTESFNAAQRRQMDYALHDRGVFVDKPKIAAFLNRLTYPLYFLDFETMQLAVPQFEGTKPYSQIPFQYSLHCIESADGQIAHREFLGVSGEDPRRELAERLCEDIPRDACVLAYNKEFECARIEELARLYPDLSTQLIDIKNNIVDLIEPFRKGYYYNKRMGGSFSIKSVLPAMFPDDPTLDYRNLEGVHNGAEAMDVFPRIKDMSGEEQAKTRRQLLEYCKLDTFAMVKIWQELTKLVNS